MIQIGNPSCFPARSRRLMSDSSGPFRRGLEFFHFQPDVERPILHWGKKGAHTPRPTITLTTVASLKIPGLTLKLFRATVTYATGRPWCRFVPGPNPHPGLLTYSTFRSCDLSGDCNPVRRQKPANQQTCLEGLQDICVCLMAKPARILA